MDGFSCRSSAIRVDKPWGLEWVWARRGRYVGKVIYVKAGEALSRQYHRVKEETLCFLGGEGVLELDGECIVTKPGVVVDIKAGQVHRLTARTDLVLVEASTPELDDVVRLDDRYGRAVGDST